MYPWGPLQPIWSHEMNHTDTNIDVLVKSSTKSVNHGPCVVCEKPILYFGCQFCSPKCNWTYIKASQEEKTDSIVVEEVVTLVEESETSPAFPLIMQFSEEESDLEAI